MTHDVERVLADIDADHGDRCVEFLRHGVLLVLSAPCQLLILAGPEHGRTIPLPDIGPEFRNGPRRRCPWSVRNSARSELAVLVQPPARRPARTFIIHVYSG